MIRNQSPEKKQKSKIAQRFIDSNKKNEEKQFYLGKISTASRTVQRISLAFRSQIQNDTSFTFTEKEIDEGTIIKAQSIFRGRQARKNFLKEKRKFIYRKNIFNELLQTERNYMEDLEKIVKVVLINLKQILEEKQIKDIFANIDSIYNLSKNVYDTLIRIEFKCFSKFGNSLMELVPFFKIYFDYVNNYNNQAKLLKQLKQENSKFKNYLANIEKELLRGEIENILIKPVQRLPKYVLLLSDLLKNTEPSHPDYKDIKKAVEEFNKVNEANNKNMDKVIINSKLFELQKLYGSQLKILDSKRQLKFEECMVLLWRNEQIPVLVYILTDLILVCQRVESQSSFNRKGEIIYKLISYLYLNTNSFLREQDELDTNNEIDIIGKNGTLKFVAESEKTKQTQIEKFNQILNELKVKAQIRQEALEKNKITSQENMKYLIEVQVIGTQQVQESTMSSYTQYIIQVEIQNIIQKIFMRFKAFLSLQKMVSEQFPSLQLPYFKDQNIFNKNDEKIIEIRKVNIMNFLQLLLQSEEMITDGKQILQYLGLPHNFYQLPTLSQTNIPLMRTSKRYPTQIRNSLPLFDAQQPVRAFNSFNSQMDQEETQNIKPQLQRTSSFQRKNKVSAQRLIKSSVDKKQQLQQKQNEIEIKIKYYQDAKLEEIAIMINQNTKCFEVIEEIAQKMNIKSAFDFRLFSDRVLEDDEILWNLVVKTQTGLCKLFSNNSNFVYNNKEIILKKHLFLTKTIEKQLNEADLNRLKLVTEQLFYNIKHSKIILKNNEYPIFTALYIYINKANIQELTQDNIPLNLIKQVINRKILQIYYIIYI